MSQTSGQFIVFEGGEGSGKSTQIRLLQAFLQQEKIPSILTLEPGGTPLGLSLRKLVLDPQTGPIAARTEALLFAAARAEHVDKIIRPALARGEWVICDRYVDASLAYQGGGRQLGLAPVRMLNDWATQGLYPDRAYLFDLEVSAGLARVQDRLRSGVQKTTDRLENEAQSFHAEIRKTYLFLARTQPARYLVLDARRSIEDIRAQIENDIREQFL